MWCFIQVDMDIYFEYFAPQPEFLLFGVTSPKQIQPWQKSPYPTQPEINAQ